MFFWLWCEYHLVGLPGSWLRDFSLILYGPPCNSVGLTCEQLFLSVELQMSGGAMESCCGSHPLLSPGPFVPSSPACLLNPESCLLQEVAEVQENCWKELQSFCIALPAFQSAVQQALEWQGWLDSTISDTALGRLESPHGKATFAPLLKERLPLPWCAFWLYTY